MKRNLIIVSSVAVFIILAIAALKMGGSKKVDDFASCVEAGYEVLESYPEQCKTPEGETFVKDIGNETEKADLIQATTPRPGAEIKSPLTIEGKARGPWYFEASFPVRLLDGDGKEIAIHYATAQDNWMVEDFVPFKSTLTFALPATENGTLILQKDNPSGLPENDDELRIPVKFAAPEQTGEMMTVKVFLGSETLNPSADCEKVFAVSRTIPKTQGVGTAALNELLKGPTATEEGSKYFTSLPNGVTLKKLTIENGVAKADFNAALDQNVAGSCRVTSIRAQITETLKQFSSVKSVVISVDGRVDDILQP